MTQDTRLIPTGSQTVGPYFRIGLEYLIDRTPALDVDPAGRIEIRGRVLDRDGIPVPDAVLEFWAPRLQVSTSGEDPYPAGFRRTATDTHGNFAVAAMRPAAVPLEDGQMQAPHILVLVFARGLLRHLLTRVYFEDEPGNTTDKVLQEIAPERRATLVARLEHSYHWDVHLQGPNETVFFAW